MTVEKIDLVERRRFERMSSCIRVEMSHPTFGTIVGLTTDISDGGAQVMIDNAVAPPKGTDVMVQFRKMVGRINDEPVAMRVMHSEKSLVGLMFLPRL